MSRTVTREVRLPANIAVGVASTAFTRAGEQSRKVVEARLITKLRCLSHLLGRETSISMLFKGSEKGSVAIQRLVETIESVKENNAALETVEKELREQALEVKQFFFWLCARIDSGESRESLLFDYAPPEFSLSMLRANASNCVLLMDKLAAVLDGTHVEAKLEIKAFMIPDQVASIVNRAGGAVIIEHAHIDLQSLPVHVDFHRTVADMVHSASRLMTARDCFAVTVRVDETPSGVVFRVLTRGAEVDGVHVAEQEHFAVHAERAEN
ncbi:hypothetical protein HY992_03060 [Candidatus Micrarchaeota archaeon]|nr:hypothetical protein [Candidatus Micrarchaeota archaeon]